MNVSEELARLAALRDQGVLTEAEFDAQKAAVLAGGTAATPPAPAKAKGKLGKGCLIVALVLVVLLVIGMIAAPGKKADGAADTAADTTTAAPPLAVTSKALSKAYEDNEAAAQAAYGGKPLAVTGRIEGIQLGIGDAPTVLLSGTNPYMHVQAALADDSKAKAAGLKKGDTITATCASVSEVVSIPMLADCEI